MKASKTPLKIVEHRQYVLYMLGGEGGVNPMWAKKAFMVLSILVTRLSILLSCSSNRLCEGATDVEGASLVASSSRCFLFWCIMIGPGG